MTIVRSCVTSLHCIFEVRLNSVGRLDHYIVFVYIWYLNIISIYLLFDYNNCLKMNYVIVNLVLYGYDVTLPHLRLECDHVPGDSVGRPLASSPVNRCTAL